MDRYRKRNIVFSVISLLILSIFSALSGCVDRKKGELNNGHDFKVDCVGLSSCVDPSGKVHVVWLEDHEVYDEEKTTLRYAMLSDYGGEVIEELTLDEWDSLEDRQGYHQCDIASGADGSAEIVYNKAGVIYRVSVGDGAPETDNLTSLDQEAMDPDIEMDGNGNIHLCWADVRSNESMIHYARYSSDWYPLFAPTPVGGYGSFNPSICTAPNGDVYLAFFSEYHDGIELFWPFILWFILLILQSLAEPHAFVSLFKMNYGTDHFVQLYTNGTAYPISELGDLDLSVSSEGCPILTWIDADIVYWLPILKELTYREPRVMDNIGENDYLIEVDDYAYEYDYLVSVDIEQNGLNAEGKVLLEVNGSEDHLLDEYYLDIWTLFFPFQDYSKTFDISRYIDGPCTIRIFLEEDRFFSRVSLDPPLLTAQINDSKVKPPRLMRISGLNETEPILVNGDMLAIIWIEKDFRNSIMIQRMTRNGERSGGPQSLMDYDGSISAASISNGPDGEIHILWETSNTKYNFLIYARKFGGSTDGPHTVSRTPRSWHWYDDLGGLRVVIGSLILLICFIVIIVSVLILLVKRRKRKRPMDAIELPLEDPQVEVTFEIVKRG